MPRGYASLVLRDIIKTMDLQLWRPSAGSRPFVVGFDEGGDGIVLGHLAGGIWQPAVIGWIECILRRRDGGKGL
jgi:hypothetical protein